MRTVPTFLSENSVSLLSSKLASDMVDGSSPVKADAASSEILSPEKLFEALAFNARFLVQLFQSIVI